MVQSETQTLLIGKLSKRTGCKIETIRYYERIGVMPEPERTGGGHRVYTEEHLKRLRFIRRARELGFTLDEVRALLNLADERTNTCAEVEAIARDHLDKVRRNIADLKVFEDVLQEMVSLCAEGTVPECPVIEALYHGRSRT